MSIRKVPHLSLYDYIHGKDSAIKKKFVDELLFGLKEYGFIVLKDHNVGQDLLDRAYQLCQEYFKLPLEKKLKYVGKNSGQRGHTPFRVEHAKDNKNPDLKEFWHVGRELAFGSPYAGIYPDNVWPKEISEFKKVFLDLYSALDQTANILLSAIGKGLGVQDHYFAEMIADGNSILRLIHYPPTEGEDVKNSIRSAAHEDINLITLLVGATDSGLELLDRDGKWLPIQSAPGEIVVDTGDMMARITNGMLPATTHRVVNPDDGKKVRYSMPFFVHPHSNALLSCLPSCQNYNGKKPEPDILSGVFLEQRLREIGLLK